MYVIHVVPNRLNNREEEVGDHWLLYKIDPEERTYNPDLNPFEDGNARTLYANEAEIAEMLANKLAESYPGCDVYVMQPSVILSAVKPEVIRKNVTKEGVLPT